MTPHDFWQEIHPPGTFAGDGEFTSFYVAALEDGRQLRLPIRGLADGNHALASLIVNQASFPSSMRSPKASPKRSGPCASMSSPACRRSA